MKKSFEEFLLEVADKVGVGEGMAKDRYIEAQEAWIEQLDVAELMEYAQDYGDWITECYEKLAR